MNFQVVSGREEIEALLPRLKTATEPGRTHDGTRLMVNYKSFGRPSARSRFESQVARDEGLDMQTYTGLLDRVFRNARGECCFSILCLERTNGDGRHHAYRTFNIVRGEVRQVVVLGTNASITPNRNGNNNKPSSD